MRQTLEDLLPREEANFPAHWLKVGRRIKFSENCLVYMRFLLHNQRVRGLEQ